MACRMNGLHRSYGVPLWSHRSDLRLSACTASGAGACLDRPHILTRRDWDRCACAVKGRSRVKGLQNLQQAKRPTACVMMGIE